MSAGTVVELYQVPVLIDVDDLPLIEGQKLTLHSWATLREQSATDDSETS